MSVKSRLDWEQLNWQDFQTLCLHLAQNLLPGCIFEEFLKTGNKQDGIDLLSVQQPGEKFITIQCKKVQSLNEGQVKIIIEEFVKNYFITRTLKFILATTASLNDNTKRALLKSKEELKSEFNVDLVTWDQSFLEQYLKKEYTLVANFFNIDTANQHCFEASRLSKTTPLQAVKDVISRKITLFQKNDDLIHPWRNADRSEVTTLLDVLTENRLIAKRICLIGDAYQGKSYLLKQTAYELQKLNIPFSPILLELKNQNVESIEHILNLSLGVWKEIPSKDIVLFIDGLDEVPTDKFHEVLLHIKTFSISYPFITTVISCRKLFFEHYKVDSVLTDFISYQLQPISENDIQQYGCIPNCRPSSSSFKVIF